MKNLWIVFYFFIKKIASLNRSFLFSLLLMHRFGPTKLLSLFFFFFFSQSIYIFFFCQSATLNSSWISRSRIKNKVNKLKVKLKRDKKKEKKNCCSNLLWYSCNTLCINNWFIIFRSNLSSIYFHHKQQRN